MAKRFDNYKLIPGDDIGNPEFLNKRFEDLDNRIHSQELKNNKIDESAAMLERVALSRLDNVFTGVLHDAQEKLRDTGAWFKAESASEFIPATGDKRFILTEATRGGYVSTRDILIVSASDDSHVMSAQLIAYTPIDGALDISIVSAFGDTEKSDWLIYPMAAGDSSHIAQRNNPHETTADQVGAYTSEETDGLIDTHKNNTSNPHSVTKAQVGLSNVDNTSDMNKPVSTLQQQALDDVFKSIAFASPLPADAGDPFFSEKFADVMIWRSMGSGATAFTGWTSINLGKSAYFYANAAPLGHLVEDGATYDRTDFPQLWALANFLGLVVAQANKIDDATRVMFGDGDGSSTFSVPDTRGLFIRSVGASYPLGVFQGDAIRNLTGEFGTGVYDYTPQNTNEYSGAFGRSTRGTGVRINAQRATSSHVYLTLDASLQVPTAPENQPAHLSLLSAIKF